MYIVLVTNIQKIINHFLLTKCIWVAGCLSRKAIGFILFHFLILYPAKKSSRLSAELLRSITQRIDLCTLVFLQAKHDNTVVHRSCVVVKTQQPQPEGVLPKTLAIQLLMI